ncbi:hypothetical protein L1987_00974 [Smallanthus sonchifolius]|uniref:Uncharacterized protein n=1 Tax=Smallanthus sonchifolius TaxID=185202 RepID=A0ACB9K3T6_9ASTR|nr:hypothetical protein L1987_00974 [Smallanthus sonchifolius]
MNKRSPRKEELLEAEVKRLREELKAANLEKSEISSEYEKLITICRSQRQQLHGIKQALASTTPPNTQPQGLFDKSSSSPDQNSWQAFPEDLKTPTLLTGDNSKPFRTMNSHQSQRFGGLKNDERNLTSQPPGWAAF